MIFVDTSGIVAYFDSKDRHHTEASQWLHDALDRRVRLLTHSHALGETIAVLQRKLGNRAVAEFAYDVEPTMEIVWVDEDLHRTGVAALLAADRRQLSLVDCVSFEVMRVRGIGTAFAFDDDFEEYGFDVVPERPKS